MLVVIKSQSSRVGFIIIIISINTIEVDQADRKRVSSHGKDLIKLPEHDAWEDN